MSIFSKLAGNTAKSIAKGVTEAIENKKDSNITKQVKSIMQYTINNMEQFCKVVFDLEAETKDLIEKVFELQNKKLSFGEKNTLKKHKTTVEKNLEYLYLCKDYFIYLSKIASDIPLEHNKYIYVIKFSSFFDGKKVLEVDEEGDDSLLGDFKEIKSELTSIFVSSNSEFCFENYLENYRDKIENLILPDIKLEIKRLEASVTSADTKASADTTQKTLQLTSICEEVTCPGCRQKLTANLKFCPECGTKIEAIKPKFCIECGTKLTSDVKFCPECGHKNI